MLNAPQKKAPLTLPTPARRPQPQMPAKLRSWRVIIMRSWGEHIGTVEVPDRERAEVVAVKLFDLDLEQRRRLLIRERL
jgi:hypothetical protein